MAKPQRPRWINFIFIVLLLGVLGYFFITNMPEREPAKEYSDIVTLFEDNQVESFTFDVGNGTLKYIVVGEEEPATYKMPYSYLFIEALPDYVESYNAENPDAPMEYDLAYSGDNSFWLYMIPFLLLLVGAGAFFYYMVYVQGDGGTKGAMSVGKAKVKNQAGADKNKTTFKDVAGADEEKEELQEIVAFLKSPRRFSALGARIPHGVLLVGPPGTGKTLLARACAGEAGVPFYSISGSDFVEMYVGVGASRVRDLFDKAKKTAPCIVFIDEIDAVGRQRGAGLGGGHDEREQTLNQLLVEMDGFDGNEGVIVLAATNRADILDHALLRPGRFDREVYVGLPDVKGREEILRVHTRQKPLAPDVDLKIIARTTPGFTGADLENLVNEAALLAARRNRKSITEKDIEEASIKVMAGPEKKSRVVTEKERRLTAYHEAGHAVTAYYCKTSDPVHQITIIPHGPAGGFTMYRPEEDVQFRTRGQMLESIVSMLGGRVSEKLVLDDISTGASNDLKRATQQARSMVTRYGFSERLGPVVYDDEPGETFLGRDYGHTRNYSEEIASEIDAEVREMMDEAFEAAKNILEEHMEQLHLVSETLLEREKISGDEFRILMEGGTLPPFDPVEETLDEPDLVELSNEAKAMLKDLAAQQYKGDKPTGEKPAAKAKEPVAKTPGEKPAAPKKPAAKKAPADKPAKTVAKPTPTAQETPPATPEKTDKEP